MKKYKSRLFYLILILLVISLGLLSRRITDYLPDLINMFLGDSLWALMVYLIIRMFYRNWTIKKVSLSSILFCYVIELSQLYHGTLINMIRRTTLGGLVLGYGFLWSDLVAYLLGISLGILIDLFLRKL